MAYVSQTGTVFTRHAHEWRDEKGAFAPLHAMNPARLGYIHDRLAAHFGLNRDDRHRYQGLRILDVGCGGGLTAWPLARLGADVTAIDEDAATISAARAEPAGHKGPTPRFEAATLPGLLKRKTPLFDAVLALEVIEHTGDPAAFIRDLMALVKPGGAVILSTLNRTPASFAAAIIGAEHILNWVPRGTHNWRDFVRPSEMAAMLRRNGAQVDDIAGIVYDPFSGNFSIRQHRVAVNYILKASKP